MPRSRSGSAREELLKSFLNEDNLNRLEAFCDEDTAMCLVMAPNCKLEPGFPAELANKGKSLAFLKVAPTVLNKEKFDPSVLVMTELQGSAPVEHLELLASECFLPVLSNPLNQRKWGRGRHARDPRQVRRVLEQHDDHVRPREGARQRLPDAA